MLITGRLGDIFGPKLLFLLGWLFMGLWTLISSFTSSFSFFCLCRALAGIGSAALAPNGMALLGRAFRPESPFKNVSFAILGAFAPAGYVFGGFLGAILSQLAEWQWFVRLLAFISFVLAAATVVFVPSQVGQRVPSTDLSFDWIGAGTASCGLILFSFAWK